MILRDKIRGKAHTLIHLFFVTILTMSFGTVHGADNLQKQALELANKEIDKYIVLCGNTWYGYQIGNKYIEMRRRAVPRIEVDKISESDMLNGFEWRGRIVYRFGPSRWGYLQKNGAMKWEEWRDYGERFTVSSNRKNGQWIMSAGNFRDPSYWESWVQRSNWFSSCSALSGQGAKDGAVGASTGGHESYGLSPGTSMGGIGEAATPSVQPPRESATSYSGGTIPVRSLRFVGMNVARQDRPGSFACQVMRILPNSIASQLGLQEGFVIFYFPYAGQLHMGCEDIDDASKEWKDRGDGGLKLQVWNAQGNIRDIPITTAQFGLAHENVSKAPSPKNSAK